MTGPLLSAFVPPLVRDALGDHRTAIGVVMAIDNFLLLLLVPWTGAASDRARASGRGRMPLIIAGFLLAAVGMVVLPASTRFGIVGLIASIVVLYTGINIQRSPLQALIADVVPSRYRSLATGSVTFQMCLGAIVFLMLGRMLGMNTAFMVAAATVLAIAAAFGFGLREPAHSQEPGAEATFRSLIEAVMAAVRGTLPGIRPVFIASLLLQLTFQTFTTWFALHGTERFGVRAEDVTLGFIAWAVGGVIGALPAGFIGVRIGRRNTMLLGLRADGRVSDRARPGNDRESSGAAARACLSELDAADCKCISRSSSSRSRRTVAACWRRSSCCRWRSAAPLAIR